MASWLALFIFATSSPGWQWWRAGNWGSPRHLPSPVAWNMAAGVFCLAAALLLRRLHPRDWKVIVCQQCQKVAVQDGAWKCACGGMFRRMSEMKWLEGWRRPLAAPVPASGAFAPFIGSNMAGGEPLGLEVHWQRASEREHARFEKAQGIPITEAGGVFWKEIRPLCFRPLLPFREFAPETVRLPLGAVFGCAQFAVPPGSRSNSFLNLLVFENAAAYSLAALGGHKSEIRSALKKFTLRQLTDAREFKREAHRVYLEFYARTRYAYKAERRREEHFSCWADSLFESPNILILGAYRQDKLGAICAAHWVEDTVLYSMAFADEESLRLNINSLMLHSVRDAAARLPGIKQVFAGMYKFNGRKGVDGFYFLRGCSLARKPALLRANPLTLGAVRLFKQQEHARLLGNIADYPDEQVMRPTLV